MADESARELMATGRAIRQFDRYLQDDGAFKSYDKAVETISYAYDGRAAEVSDVSSALTTVAAPTKLGTFDVGASANNARTFIRQLHAIEGNNGKTVLNAPAVIDDLDSAYGAAQRTPVKPVVTARSTVNGHIFEDTNQSARVAPNMDRPTLIAERIAEKQSKTTRPLPNGNMRTAHAEIGNIQQAYEAGVTKGADMQMHVAGEPVCGYCNGDIAAAARAAELNSLTILEEYTGRTFIWTPGMKSVKKGIQ